MRLTAINASPWTTLDGSQATDLLDRRNGHQYQCLGAFKIIIES
jgi:hypothetical protein